MTLLQLKNKIKDLQNQGSRLFITMCALEP